MSKSKYELMEQRKKEGKLFGDTPEWMFKGAIAKTLVGRFNRSWSINIVKRAILEKMIFSSFGKSLIEPPIRVCVGKNITIGDFCYLNFNTVLLDDDKIVIEDNVMFGPNVTILTSGHPVYPEYRTTGVMYSAPVTIKKGAWLCSGVTVLPGVTIGENAVIAAGSVVTKDIPENVVAMGIPCKPVREINEQDKMYYYKDRKYEDGKL